MDRVAADVETFHLGFGDLDAFLVDPRVEGALDFEPGLGACRRDEVDDGGVVCERPAAPILRDAAEQAVLDLVPFRCAWRIVPDPRITVRGRVSSASFCSSTFQSRTREPFEPPQSAVIVSSPAFG